jgi:hypothetical protein
MRRFIPLLAMAVACSDSGVKPNAAETLAIHVEEERIREAVVVVGDSVRLTVRSVTGNLASRGGVAWSTDDVSVIRLGSSGENAVHAHGLSPGNARVVARAGELSDTVVISVLAGPPTGHCDEEGGLRLFVAESFTTTAAAAPLLCLAPVAGAASDYLVVPFSASLTAQRLRVRISGEGIQGPRGSTSFSPRISDAESGQRSLEDFATEFDRRLREREARDLAPRVRRRGPDLLETPRPSIAANALPAVGDTMVINVNAHQTCSQRIDRRARVRRVSNRAVFLEDTTNPAGGFTDADYQAFALAFDQLVHPTITTSFGAPTDIDENGRVLIIFTRAVNELTPAGSSSFVSGFFYSRDLFPRRDTNQLSGCAGSNAAEILYMLAPDPTGTINGNARPRDLLLERTVGVLAHELQHLINASRRLHVLGATNWNEEFWLNEGLSHIAEELMFYATTPHEPGQTITIGQLRNGVGQLARFNQYQVSNASRYSDFLKNPEDASPLHGTSLATRGASWAFLRYVADRRGGDQSAFWRRLIDSDATGYSNLMSALGSSPLGWMHDWSVALYVDDLTPVSTRFRQPSWHHRSILPALSSNNGAYPLRIISMRQGDPVSVDLVAAGSATIHVAVPADSAPRISFTSGGANAPPELRYTVLRLR